MNDNLPLDDAVRRVGDRWALLVVDALLGGPQRFGELAEALGIAPNVLTRRLRQLEDDGVLVAEPYSDRPPRHRYRLTATGAELAGALRLLTQWGAGRAGPGTGSPFHHATCGTAVEARWWCPTCARRVDSDETTDLRFA